MKADSVIYVAGHGGLAGSAIARRLQAVGYKNLVTRTRAELELTDAGAVERFFAEEKPEYVFLAAARVGGILANMHYPAQFIAENLRIQTNVLHAAWRTGVQRLIFLGSSCVYPRDCAQPIREDYLLSGPLELSNRPYAVAKIAGIEMCRAYNQQYGTRYLSVMPTNLFGPADNYDLENSHVLPALIRKLHEAKQRGNAEAVVWGSGAPRREFLYSDDMADACVLLMSLPGAQLDRLLRDWSAPLINIGCGVDVTIRELAQIVGNVVGFEGHLRFDLSKPDGTPRKVLDISRISGLGWSPKIALARGIELAYGDYLERFARVESKRTAAFTEQGPA